MSIFDELDFGQKDQGQSGKLSHIAMQCTARWVQADRAVDGVSLDVNRIIDAVEAGMLDRLVAAKFAARRIGWAEAYRVHFGRWPVAPVAGVREGWRRIPRKYQSPDERRLADEASSTLPLAGLRRF